MAELKNPKHELFAQELAKGVSASEAYVLAGYKANSGNAATLKAQESISKRVSAILKARETIEAKASELAIERTAITKQWVIERLRRNALVALGEEKVKLAVLPRGMDTPVEVEMSMRDASAANRSLELLGKELGMFIDRKETGSPGEFAGIDNASTLEGLIAKRLGLARPGDSQAGSTEGERSLRGKPSGLH